MEEKCAEDVRSSASDAGSAINRHTSARLDGKGFFGQGSTSSKPFGPMFCPRPDQ